MTKRGAAIFILVTTLLTANSARAQTLAFSASVDSPSVYVGQQLTLTLTLMGSDFNLSSPVPRPDLLPQLDFLRAGGPQTRQSTTWINGRMTRTMAVTYELYYIAQRPGKVTIPSLRYLNASTLPIHIEVLEAPELDLEEDETGFRPTHDPYVKVSVDKKEVYVGEQIVATWSLYFQTPLVNVDTYRRPQLGSFLAEELSIAKTLQSQTVRFGDKEWQSAFLMSMALFPFQSGEATIDSLAIRYRSRSEGGGFFMPRVIDQLSTSPLVGITVKNLPETDRPSGFTGAVGTFEIGLDRSTGNLPANDPFEFKLVVTGTGHPDMVPTPTTDIPAEFDLYVKNADKKMKPKGDSAEGVSVYTIVLVPHQEGDYTIGPFAFYYFDPADEKYKQARSPLIRLQVGPPRPGAETAPVEDEAETVIVAGKDLRYIKTEVPVSSSGRWILGSKSALALQALPFCFLAGAVFLRRRSERIQTDTGYARKLRAEKLKKRLLKQAEASAAKGDKTAAYSQAHRALALYVAGSLNRPGEGVTTDEAVEALKNASVSEDLIERTREVLSECDLARFAPGAVSIGPAAIIDKIRKLASELDKVIS